MKIQINTGHNVTIDTATEQAFAATIAAKLAHFSERITRIELHVSDEDGTARSGPRQILAMLEARLAGRQPDTVTAKAATPDLAVHEAANKMHHLLDDVFSRARHH